VLTGWDLTLILGTFRCRLVEGRGWEGGRLRTAAPRRPVFALGCPAAEAGEALCVLRCPAGRGRARLADRDGRYSGIRKGPQLVLRVAIVLTGPRRRQLVACRGWNRPEAAEEWKSRRK